MEYGEVIEMLPGGDELISRASFGWKNENPIGQGKVAGGKESQAAFTLHSGEAVVVEDLRTEKRFNVSPLLLQNNAVSGMSVIIQGQDRPFGVLAAYTISSRKFLADDVDLLTAVANVLAEAIARKQSETALREKRSEVPPVGR